MKIVATLLFCFIASFIYAQEKFIEVVVSDTILIEPETWTYSVYLQEYDYTEATMVDTVAAPSTTSTRNNYQEALAKTRQRNATIISNVTDIAKKNGGQDIGINENGANLRLSNSSQNLNGRTFRFKSREQMQNFVKQIKSIPKLTGNVVSSYHSSPDKMISRLYTKLIKTATARAEAIAALSKNKIGKIVQVTEATNPEKSASDAFFEAMMRSERGGGITGSHSVFASYPPDMIRVEKSFKVKFSID